MTFDQFAPMFATLAIQLREKDADVATARGYFIALKDLEPEFVALAATRLATTAEWFPKTPEWRAMARTIERERTDEVKARLRKLPTPLCLACDDTGFRPAEGLFTGRVIACECRELRRLEVLGRRPMPQLPAATEDTDVDPRMVAAADELAANKGMA